MPTDRLTPGLKTEIVTIVDDKLVVKHMGGDGVLSTPSMIALMERASNRDHQLRDAALGLPCTSTSSSPQRPGSALF